MVNYNKYMLRGGHRGAAGYEPENTLRSFKKALDLSVGIIELDVHRAKTGEIVSMHDKTVCRTTNGNGYVSGLTLKELLGLDAGDGEKVPTLEEVLDWVAGRAKLNIEIKSYDATEGVAKLIQDYVARGTYKYGDFVVSSFNWLALIKMRILNSQIPLGVLIHTRPLKLAFVVAKITNAYAFHPHYTLVNKKMVKKVHNKNMKLFTWTVNEREDIEKMKKLGVDGIFSDYPDRI